MITHIGLIRSCSRETEAKKKKKQREEDNNVWQCGFAPYKAMLLKLHNVANNRRGLLCHCLKFKVCNPINIYIFCRKSQLYELL